MTFVRYFRRQEPQQPEVISSIRLDVTTKMPTTKPASSQVDGGKSSGRRRILALIMLFSYVAVLVLASQLASIAFIESKFKAPMLFIIIKMLFRAMTFPMYLLINAMIKLLRHKKINLGRTLRRCEGVCGPEGLTLRVLVVKFGLSSITLILVQVGYTLATANLSTAVSTAVYSLAVEISYILSWLVLKHPLLLIKTIFVIISFGGAGLIAYASIKDSESKESKLTFDNMVVGIPSGILAAVALSSHQLAFKKAFGKSDFGQASYVVSVMYVLQALIFWPVPVIAKISGLEDYDIRDMPYDILLGSWIGYGTSSIFYGYGLVLSSPFFMSIAELLVLAVNSGIDVAREFKFSSFQIAGTCLIAVSFTMMIMPDNWLSITIRRKPVVQNNIDQLQLDEDYKTFESDLTLVNASENVIPVPQDDTDEEDTNP